MKTKPSGIVHPWYRGIHEWKVERIAELGQPIEYNDTEQGQVSYDPKIMLLEAEGVGKVLWLPYWMATNKTKGRLKWGQRPPMLEESAFLDLMKDAIKKGLFSKDFLEKLDRELELALK